MCDCISKLEEAIEKKHGEFEFINLEISIDFKTGGTKERFPCLEYYYYPKKQDGTPSKKKVKAYIGHSHCPVCGTKYE